MLEHTRLRALRNARGLHQAEIAACLNISREAYSMYETGRRQPSNELIADMARFFNVSMDYLSGLADVPDSFADLDPQSLFISRSLSRLDDQTRELLAIVTRYGIENQAARRRVSRSAETGPGYSRRKRSSSAGSGAAPSDADKDRPDGEDR